MSFFGEPSSDATMLKMMEDEATNEFATGGYYYGEGEGHGIASQVAAWFRARTTSQVAIVILVTLLAIAIVVLLIVIATKPIEIVLSPPPQAPEIPPVAPSPSV